ncbi:unnamed protein product [Urochloa humidicola]
MRAGNHTSFFRGKKPPDDPDASCQIHPGDPASPTRARPSGRGRRRELPYPSDVADASCASCQIHSVEREGEEPRFIAKKHSDAGDASRQIQSEIRTVGHIYHCNLLPFATGDDDTSDDNTATVASAVRLSRPVRLRVAERFEQLAGARLHPR